MKLLTLATALLIGASTIPALADSGPPPVSNSAGSKTSGYSVQYKVPNYMSTGNPFPYAAPASDLHAAPPARDTGSAGYQRADGHATIAVTGPEVPPNNNEGPMQTVNSLPPGYAEGGDVAFLNGRPMDQQTTRVTEVPAKRF